MAKKKDEKPVVMGLGANVDDVKSDDAGAADERATGGSPLHEEEFDAAKMYELLEDVQAQLAEQGKVLDLLKPETIERLEALLEADITPIEDVNEKLEELVANFEKVAKWAHRQGYR